MCVVAFGETAQASILYGGDDSRNLYRIDTVTGAWTVVGTKNWAFSGYFGLTYNGNTGVMYGFDAEQAGGMGTVDLTTGEGSFITNTGRNGYEAVFSSDFSVIYRLELDRSLGPILYMVNPTTGQIRVVGVTGVAAAQGLTRNSVGVLYAMANTFAENGWDSKIYTLDADTGHGTLVQTLTFTDGITAISFDEDDNLFGTTPSGQLIRIDLPTGTTTAIGDPLPRHMRGLDFLRPASDGGNGGGSWPGGQVPEPSSIVCWLTMLGTIGGLASWRRYRRAP